MANTQEITLDQTPIQITDGSQQAFVQSSLGREFSFSHSESRPSSSSVAHVARELSVSPPFKIWAWSKAESPIKIIISVA